MERCLGSCNTIADNSEHICFITSATATSTWVVASIIIRPKLHVCLYVCMLNELNCVCVCVGPPANVLSRHLCRQRAGQCSRQRVWQRQRKREVHKREVKFMDVLGVLILAACVSHWCLSCMCVYICVCIVRFKGGLDIWAVPKDFKQIRFLPPIPSGRY